MSFYLPAFSFRRLAHLSFFILLIVCWLIVPTTPVKAASRFTVAIANGNVTVDNMSSIPTNRITWLVQRADRSTCSTDPGVECDGLMSTNDRVVVADNYIAFIDLTRNGTNGGGGLLRGVWMLTTDATGTKTFKYTDHSKGRAVNNLRPGQYVGAGGDALEFLVLPLGGSDPFDTYRASRTLPVEHHFDGVYSNNSLYYQFGGHLTRGDGSSGNPYKTNIASDAKPATMYYVIGYTFYNGYHPFATDGNSYVIQVDSSLTYKCQNPASTATCGPSPSINTAVLSLSISDTRSSGARVNYFKPVTHDMAYNNYSPSCVVSPYYLKNNEYGLSGTTHYFGSLVKNNIYESFDIKYKVDSGQTLNKFRIKVFDTSVYAPYMDLPNKPHMLMIYDYPNRSIAFDMRAGAAGVCGGELGSLTHGEVIAFVEKLGLDYNNP